MRVLAIIPARGGSKRLPGKNTKPLLGKPLIAWSIEFAKSMHWFADIQVSTDSAEIAAICTEHGLAVPRLRPAELATDTATSIDVALDVLSWKRSRGEEFDAVALLQPTTPVRFKPRWEEAYTLLSSKGCDGVIGVSVADIHPYLIMKNSDDGFLEPWVPNPANLVRSQDYPPAFVVNGALYLIRVDALVGQRTFFPQKCRSVVCTENVENIDIDTFFDWQAAEMSIAEWMARQ